MLLPRITIVTPSFNQAEFIGATINSVLAQDYPNLEYIVIDGGSKDGSVDIIKRYNARLAYWVSESDKGQSDAINKGFRRSSGDILIWLNSDDLLIPGALKNVADYFVRFPAVGCMIGDLDVIDARGTYLFTRRAIPFDFPTALFTASLVPQPATFFTRAAWALTGDVDVTLQYQMDCEYFLRMARAGVEFGLVKKRLAAFRLHAASKTVSEYGDKVRLANRTIQRRHCPERWRVWLENERRLKAAAWAYRARGYVVRALLRGELVPLKAARARTNAAS